MDNSTHTQHEAEQAARRASHILTEAKWQAFLDGVRPGLTRYEQIRSLGGMAKARELYKSTQVG